MLWPRHSIKYIHEWVCFNIGLLLCMIGFLSQWSLQKLEHTGSKVDMYFGTEGVVSLIVVGQAVVFCLAIQNGEYRGCGSDAYANNLPLELSTICTS